jgi:hypothetical protein
MKINYSKYFREEDNKQQLLTQENYIKVYLSVANYNDKAIFYLI